MSLFKSVIESNSGRGSHLFGTATSILFNGDGVYGLTANDTTKSAFFYNLNIKNDREGVVRVESEDPTYVIQSEINKGFLYKFITLSVYKDAIVSSETEAYTILSKNICLAYDVEMGAVVYIRQGNKLKRIITEESINDILLETMFPFPGGITIIDAYTITGYDRIIRMAFLGGGIEEDSTTGENALHLLLSVTINGEEQDLTETFPFLSLGGQYLTFFLPEAVEYGDEVLMTYIHNAGGGLGWNDGAVSYLEDFTDYPVRNNASEVTTTTSTTSSTSTSTSSTSTSSTSTSSTSTSSTSTSSTSTTTTSTTSTSSTSTSTTTTTTLDDEEIWTDGVDTFRFIIRDSKACLDQTITATGFGAGGVQGVDWDNIWEKTAIPSNAQLYESGWPMLYEGGGFMLEE